MTLLKFLIKTETSLEETLVFFQLFYPKKQRERFFTKNFKEN